MNKNKLTLKQLQAQLDELKNNKTVPSDIKLNINPNIEIKKSSLIFGYLLSWAILFIGKIPLFNKIYKLLKWYYGRTTLWAALILIRKVFIVINAIIGVLAVFSITGFGAENLLAGFVGMGYNYIEIITSLTKRLFNWFFDLFDYKVVPNIPNNKPNLWSGGHNSPLNSIGWFSKPMVNESLFNLDQLTVGKGWNPSPIQSNSYLGDWSTWLWIVGGVVLGVSLICGGLYSYYYYIPAPAEGETGNIFYRYGEAIYEKINEITDSINDRLNPMTWFTNIRTRIFGGQAPNLALVEEVFRNQQSHANTMDNRFYPYTNNDPIKPWFHRWRISIFGETEAELTTRMFDRQKALRFACEILDKRPGLIPSAIQTPGGLGLRLQLDPSFWPDWTNQVRTEELLRRLPQTPANMPFYIPDFVVAGPSGSYTPGLLRGTLTQNYPVSTPLLEVINETNEWAKSNSGTSSAILEWKNSSSGFNSVSTVPTPSINLNNELPAVKIKND